METIRKYKVVLEVEVEFDTPNGEAPYSHCFGYEEEGKITLVVTEGKVKDFNIKEFTQEAR